MSHNRRSGNEVPSHYWSPPQAYIFATITLLVGLAVGYLLRGSGSNNTPTFQASVAAPSVPVSGSFGQSVAPPTGQLPPISADAKVAPLLQQLQSRPTDPALLADIGNAYYDAQQYPQAVDYYQRVLKLQPENVNVRTDMGTAMFYSGDADGALRQYEQSLKYQPTYAQTLFNMGIVKWQGKKDGKGALQVWERLLATNPNYPDRQKLEQLMQQARAGS